MAEDRDDKGRFLPEHSQPGPGRDSKYDPEMNDQARKLALLGLTDKEMAEFFGVDESTLNNWKHEHIAFFQSLMEGKTIADANVADSLYRRATGEVVFAERRVKVAEGEYDIIRLSQKVPSDPGAAKLWLTNRQPDKWRERSESTVTLKDERAPDEIEDAIESKLAGIAGSGGSKEVPQEPDAG